MTKIQIHQQIAFLRKQKGMTQEELANALGVSNQAVSKWESAQCCPDIQFLPELARLFQVSIDELMGYQPVAPTENLILELRRKVESLPEGDDFQFIFRAAAALHISIFTKVQNVEHKNSPSGWDMDDAIRHACNGEWGYSCCNIPSITTKMRHGCVFFSDNQNLGLEYHQMNRIASCMKTFSDIQNLKTAIALYELTLHDENAHVPINSISAKCNLSEETIRECLTTQLAPYLSEEDMDGQTGYRFMGAYMDIIPVLSLFDICG